MCSKLYDFSQMCYLQVLRVLAGDQSDQAHLCLVMAFKVVGVQVHSSNVTMQVLVRELKYIAAMASGMWVLFGSLFMFSTFYQLDLHNESFVALEKSTMEHLQK
jgi:phage gp46-like protein